MAQVQIADVVVPAEFTAYQVENSMVSTALYHSGVAVPNGEMQAQLEAGAESFAVPFWSDLPDGKDPINRLRASTHPLPPCATIPASDRSIDSIHRHRTGCLRRTGTGACARLDSAAGLAPIAAPARGTHDQPASPP